MEHAINCFDCKIWHDEDLVVYYPDEGLYRCHACAYKHEKKVNAALTTRLQEAEAVIKDLNSEIPSSTIMFYGWLGELRRRAAAWLKGGTE